MKKIIPVVLALFIGFIVGAYTFSVIPSHAAFGGPTRWEYKTTSSIISSANRLGQEGWELVAATKDDFYFKRELK